MKPRSFLRMLLAAPLVVPLLALGSDSGIAFLLVMSFAFGAVPYLVTATFLWFRVGRCNSQSSAIGMILSAPLIFAPIQAFAWLLWGWLHPDANDSLATALGLAATGVFIGYAYAAFAIAIFVGAVRLGFVSGFPSVESLPGKEMTPNPPIESGSPTAPTHLKLQGLPHKSSKTIP